jgi:hypothetical protein
MELIAVQTMDRAHMMRLGLESTLELWIGESLVESSLRMLAFVRRGALDQHAK